MKRLASSVPQEWGKPSGWMNAEKCWVQEEARSPEKLSQAYGGPRLDTALRPQVGSFRSQFTCDGKTFEYFKEKNDTLQYILEISPWLLCGERAEEPPNGGREAGCEATAGVPETVGVEVIQDEGRAQTGRGPGEVAGTTHRMTNVTTEGK